MRTFACQVSAYKDVFDTFPENEVTRFSFLDTHIPKKEAAHNACFQDNKTEDGERHEVVLLVCLLS